MLEVFEPWLMRLAVLSAFTLAAIYIYFKISFSYFKKRGIPYLPGSAPFGNVGTGFLSKKGSQQQIVELYKEFEGHKVGGIFKMTKPFLLLRDPEIIKDVLVKDFDYFYARGFKINEKRDPLQGHLFNLSGTKWRNLRVKLTPTFTSGKMKMMFGTLVECAQELKSVLQPSANLEEVIEIKDLMARYTTDIIASCAFGVQCNCLKNPDADFRQWGRKINRPSTMFYIHRILVSLIPAIGYFFTVPLTPHDVREYFTNMVKETVEYREKNRVERNDFMQLMIKLKNKTLGANDSSSVLENGTTFMGELDRNDPFDVTMDVITAQAFVFFIAGFETSSTTMTFCLYELAVNPDIQETVRAEIDNVLKKHGGNITYESVFEMEYLDKVVSETLRKYPPVMLLSRECMKSTKLRGLDVVVEKGVQVYIPIKALHYDPKYFPDPERFDPERFSEKEKAKRPVFSYLPFGEGPRLCIGMRFGLMQTKVGLISLLSNYEVKVSHKTPIPLVLDDKAFILSAAGGMWLKIMNRSHKN